MNAWIVGAQEVAFSIVLLVAVLRCDYGYPLILGGLFVSERQVVSPLDPGDSI